MRQTRRAMLAATIDTLFSPAVASGQSETFRIGALNPITGAGSPYGSGMQRMILAAVEEINAAGSVLGWRLGVFADDTQTTPQAAVLAAKKLLDGLRASCSLRSR